MFDSIKSGQTFILDDNYRSHLLPLVELLDAKTHQGQEEARGDAYPTVVGWCI